MGLDYVLKGKNREFQGIRYSESGVMDPWAGDINHALQMVKPGGYLLAISNV